jgi:hypothetical protein
MIHSESGARTISVSSVSRYDTPTLAAAATDRDTSQDHDVIIKSDNFGTVGVAVKNSCCPLEQVCVPY